LVAGKRYSRRIQIVFGLTLLADNQHGMNSGSGVGR
jgi:hypothetical protein